MTAPTTTGTPPLRTPTWLSGALTRIEGDPRLDLLVAKLRPAAERLGNGRAGEVLQGRWLGHALHPLLTDLTLGCFTSANLLDLVGGRAARSSAQRLVGMGLLAVPGTAAAGISDWSTIDSTRTRRAGAAHAAGNTVVALCYLGSWRARRRGRHARGVVLGLAGGAVATAAGYLGGHLSFARQAGTGERGLEGTTGEQQPPRRDARTGDELVDLTRAGEIMGVPAPQVLAMVDEGLLDPATTEPELRFRDAEVEALRLLGG
jgi:uncharacterized membrane protein